MGKYQVIHSQLLKDLFHLGALGQILVQIEKVFKLELGEGQQLSLSRRKTGHVECLLNAPPVIFRRSEQFYDAAKMKSIFSAFYDIVSLVVDSVGFRSECRPTIR